MNKKELIDAVAAKAGLPRTQAARAVDAALAAMTEALKKDEKVQLMGFGTFEPKVRPARMGRNPRTGEPTEIAESWRVAFKPGSLLRGKPEK